MDRSEVSQAKVTSHTDALSTGLPWLNAVHSINEFALGISNPGVLGKPLGHYDEEPDVFTGAVYRNGVVFPRASRRSYLYTADLCVAGRNNKGVAVSPGFVFGIVNGEMLPPAPPGQIIRRSSTQIFGGPDQDAISEEDLICDYSDSLAILIPQPAYRPTTNTDPLNIGVHQESYGWSMGYAADFIFISFRIRNQGMTAIRDLVLGLHVVPDAALASPLTVCGTPVQVCGLHRQTSSPFGCGYTDTLNLAWHASTSGQPYHQQWQEKPLPDAAEDCLHASTRGIFGVLPLAVPGALGNMRYNWWATATNPNPLDFRPIYFEPTQNPTVQSFYPTGHYNNTDKDLLRLLTAEEVDYNSYWTSRLASGPLGGAIPLAVDIANHITLQSRPEYLLAWGPVSLPPGAEVGFVLALIGGENLHVDPNNYLNLPHRPDLYEAGLDFSDLDKNALVARWIYDNPGIDTDDDGYFGEFRVCVRDSVLVGDQWIAQKADTQWYKGDGIPDFRGALPPPAPYAWVTSVENGLKVRFNGQVSETEKDIFLQKPDFEGYRVYIGRDERVASLSVAASYDIEDYDKYRYNLSLEEPDWQLTDEPFSKDELRCLYGLTVDPCNDSTFDPLLFTQMSPYRHPLYPNDSLFWFKPHDYNAATYGISTPITKIYPDMPDPRLLPADSITEDMYTADGYLKFYEYECTIENILPTVSYCINVTAFDYGSPAMGVAPMESDKSEGIIEAFPLHELDQPLSGSDNIYVFPNPYRIDINYRELGLEGRNQDDRWDERVRAVWFANLPPVCTIHIYTIDGDRVRTIEHNVPATDPTSRRHSWDLINRNYQKVESGLYYWVVEIPGDKTQIGKLALIR